MCDAHTFCLHSCGCLCESKELLRLICLMLVEPEIQSTTINELLEAKIDLRLDILGNILKTHERQRQMKHEVTEKSNSYVKIMFRVHKCVGLSWSSGSYLD